MKQVAIIMLNYNQNDYTLKCIDSVLQLEYNDFQILLIDNGSVIETYENLKNELPKDSRINLHRIEHNRGYVGGMNYGLEQGAKLNSDYFLIMNNDTIIDTNAVSELVNTCKKNGNRAIVTGKVYHYDEPDKLQDIGYTYKNKNRLQFNRIGLNEVDTGKYDQVVERDMIDDVFWLLPSDLYKKIEGYSQYFWFNAEQADFALRAKKVGYKLIYTYKAKLWHKGSVSIGGRNRNPKLAYWHIQSTLIFRYRHLSKFQFVLQFIRLFIGIIGTYAKTFIEILKQEKNTYQYANAKFSGFIYFLKWFFFRYRNTGSNPFDKDKSE